MPVRRFSNIFHNLIEIVIGVPLAFGFEGASDCCGLGLKAEDWEF